MKFESVMNILKSETSRFFIAAGLGLLFGYLLWRGVLVLPVEWVLPAMLYVGEIFKPYGNDWGRNAGLVTGQILMAIPNTMLISVLAACVIRVTQEMRSLIYASLAWPIFIYLSYWYQTSKAATGFAIMGSNPTTAFQFAQVEFAPKAIFIFIIYSLYLLLALIFSRILTKYFQRT